MTSWAEESQSGRRSGLERRWRVGRLTTLGLGSWVWSTGSWCSSRCPAQPRLAAWRPCWGRAREPRSWRRWETRCHPRCRNEEIWERSCISFLAHGNWGLYLLSETKLPSVRLTWLKQSSDIGWKLSSLMVSADTLNCFSNNKTDTFSLSQIYCIVSVSAGGRRLKVAVKTYFYFQLSFSLLRYYRFDLSQGLWEKNTEIWNHLIVKHH